MADRVGGIRSLQHTRQYLSNLGFLVVPEQVGIPKADTLLDASGALADERLRNNVEAVGAAVTRLAMRLAT